eukprot:3940699-Rhodomonas_salina.3
MGTLVKPSLQPSRILPGPNTTREDFATASYSRIATFPGYLRSAKTLRSLVEVLVCVDGSNFSPRQQESVGCYGFIRGAGENFDEV